MRDFVERDSVGFEGRWYGQERPAQKIGLLIAGGVVRLKIVCIA
jgi:hypothetical protein